MHGRGVLFQVLSRRMRGGGEGDPAPNGGTAPPPGRKARLGAHRAGAMATRVVVGITSSPLMGWSGWRRCPGEARRRPRPLSMEALPPT